MYIHHLTFTTDQHTRLYELYRKLMGRLEKGQGLPPEYFIGLQQYMQTMLRDQIGLTDLWQQVQQEPHGYHHLHLTHEDKTLLNLPWQIAIDTRQYPSVFISKGLPGLYTSSPYAPHTGPLKILVMIASPEDLDHEKRLSYEEEEQVILKVLAPLWETGEVQVDFTEDGSLQGLERQLQRRQYHILYFSGHGAYQDNTGYLQLENAATLETEYVTAQQLAQVIKAKPEHMPPLIILSSCQTAQGDIKEGFRGVADELIFMDVPSVVAMAFSISDDYAILFTAHLYQGLASRLPLAEAYTRALLAIQEEEQRELANAGLRQYYPSQWLIPQLYCSQEVVHIVDWQTAGETSGTAAVKFIGGEEFLLLSPGKDYHFIGRRRESALLLSKLAHHQPVLLRGQGGVGKTALAEHLAKRLISQDPGRYCFAFDETTIGINGMITRLRQYLEKEGQLTAIEFELQRRVDASGRLDLLIQQVSLYCNPVWIFDNMESFQQDTDGPLKNEYAGWMEYVKHRLLTRFPVIFTGRYLIRELPDIFHLSLNEVSLVDYYRKCLQLHVRSIQQENFHLSLFDTARMLYRTLGGSYRALEFFDEIYSNDKPRVQELLKQMHILQQRTDHRKALKREIQERLAGDAKRIVFSTLLGVLSRQELETFHFLLYFKWPVLQMALDMQRTGRNFDSDLRRLTDLTLVEEQIKGDNKFYYVTPLVRDWMEDIKMPYIEFYPEYAGDYFEHVFDKVTHIYGDLEVAFTCYYHGRHISKINKTGAWLVSEYFRLGLYDEVSFYGKKVEEIAGVYTHEEVFNNLGQLNLKYGKFDAAISYLTKFLIASRRLGDKNKEASALNAISQVHYQKGDADTALVWLEKSRQMAKENKHLENEAVALTNTGNIYADRKQYDEALKIYQQSLDIRKVTGNRQGEIIVLTSISHVYSQQGKHEKVIQTLQKCLSIAIEMGHRREEGSALIGIGLEYERLEKFEMALDYFEKGLAISEEIGDMESMGSALTGLGITYKMLGDLDKAVECLAKGSQIIQRFGYNLDATTSWHLGNISILRGDYAEALPLLLESLPGLRQDGRRDIEGATLFDIGEAYLALGQFDEAIEYLKECTAIRQELRDKKGEITTLNRLSQAYASKGDVDTTLKYLKKTLAVQQRAGDRAGEAITYTNLVAVCAKKGDEEGLLTNLLKAYAINEEINDLGGLYFSGLQLGYFLCLKEDPDSLQTGLLLLEQSYEIGIQSDYPGVEGIAEKIKIYAAASH